MVIKVKNDISKQSLEIIYTRIEQYGCEARKIEGKSSIVVAIIGDTTRIDIKNIEELEGVLSVKRISTPVLLVSREFKNEDTVVKVGNFEFKNGNFIMIGGPCSVENELQINTISKYVVNSNTQMLRGGIFKPRTSPYAFQGLGESGLELLEKVRSEYNIPIITELMTIEQVEKYGNRVDMIQIGARNMQNFELLKVVGKGSTPVLLKRGPSATIEELLNAAEYIMMQGNKNIVLCERGIRTFEIAYRNVTDINAIPTLKSLTHLPVIVDPSHSTGNAKMVREIALASIAAGADGLIVETHYMPEIALSDGPQSIDEKAYLKLVADSHKLFNFMNELNKK